MPHIHVTHADSGVIHAHVVKRERISPHFVRVTLGGEDLHKFHYQGFDQWFRLALPVAADTRFDNLPEKFNMGGYLKYLSLPKGTRPLIRNYTVRQFRDNPPELDIDFAVHGSQGHAGPWAQTVEPGAQVAFIDQGCGYAPVPGADWILLAGDESALPAIVGVLRDMPANVVGHAFIELHDEHDRQDVSPPQGMHLHWLTRHPDQAPGSALLPAVYELSRPTGTPYAFAVGERNIATGVRRFLVKDCNVPKANVTFSGYWRVGHAAM